MRELAVTFAPLVLLATMATFALILLDNSISGEEAMARMKRDSKNCQTKRVLIVSFDGFRWNYLNRTETPNFHKFIHNGVQARYGLINAFITKTFPNHYTLATGLWEESHNIVANKMYDPVLKLRFSPHMTAANEDPVWFDAGGEPIWVTNQLKGNSHSGVIMWVGGGARVHDTLPTKFVHFDREFKNETKIDTIIKWFKEDCHMNLGMMYFTQPDEHGHEFGPESEQVTQMIGGLDELVGYLLRQFEEEGLLESTNIILTSDHGFASTPTVDQINLDNYIDPKTWDASSTSPVAAIWPHQGYLDEIYANLTSAAETDGHFIIYKKEDIPDHFHYKNSKRIAPIILIANEFYYFTSSHGNGSGAGNHGYDNRLGDMHPFFLAMGPDFKSGFAVDSFKSVDVYPLMCHLLQIQPSPNNGSLDIVSRLLKSSMNENRIWNNPNLIVPLIIGACLIVITVGVGGACYRYRYRQIKKKESIIDEDTCTEDEESILFTSEGAHIPLIQGGQA